MRGILVLVLSLGLTTGCVSTTYSMQADSRKEVRLSPARPGERSLRRVSVDVREHYYLLGFIPADKHRNIADEVELAPGEALVNTRITNEMSSIDCAIVAGLLVLTSGLGLLVWTTRTTTIEGEIVKMSDAKDEPKAEEAPAKKSEPATKLTWTTSHEHAHYKRALEICRDINAALPTREEVNRGKEQLTEKVQEVWTSESEGEDAWHVSVDSGAAFLENKSAYFQVVCVHR